MALLPTDPTLIHAMYEEFKFWVAIGGAFFGLFRGIEWIKRIKTNDLFHLQQSADSLHEELRTQTTAIVGAVATNTGELRELRSDLRTFLAVFTKPVSPKRTRKRNKSRL